MSWAKLDDAMPENDKIAELSDAAFRAQVTAICHCARRLTDGYLPFIYGKQYAGTGRVLKELIPGCWHLASALCEKCAADPVAVASVAGKADGFYVHDYLEFNPTREWVEEQQKLAHEAKSRGGKARAANAQRAGGRFTSTSPAEQPADAPAGGPAGPPADPQKSTSRGHQQNQQPTSPVSRIPITSSSDEEVTPPKRERVRALTENDVVELRDIFPLLNVDREAEKYRDWVRAKGIRRNDHVAGFRNWLRRAEDDERNRTAGATVGARVQGPYRPAARTLDAAEQLRERMATNS